MKNRCGSSVFLLLALLGALALPGCGRAEPKITLVAITPAPEETIDTEALQGSWYGYWDVSEAEGYWEEVDGRSWDCCGEVLAEEDGISLLLWDEDMPRSNCLAKIRIKEEDGQYRCTGGMFLNIAVTPGETSLRLLSSQGPLLQITGSFDDSFTGSFCYTVCLRPWGDTWPDTGRRPHYYESWYLPKIKTSDSAPDSIKLP